MSRFTVTGWRCDHCKHEWTQRRSAAGKPKMCPKCKRPTWDKPKRSR